MPNNEINKKLDELYKGVSGDIYNAEESLFLDQAIQDHAEEINNKKFGHLLGRMQLVRLDYARLYICRIFEETNKRYPLRSIPTILTFMVENKDGLEILDRRYLLNKIVQLGGESQIFEKLKNSQIKDPEVTETCVSFFSSELEKPGVTKPLDSIKTARDKHIAHHEDIKVDELPAHTYEELDSLVELAKNFISAVAGGYLNVAYECDGGEFPTTDDAKRSSRVLERLLKKADVIENDMPTPPTGMPILKPIPIITKARSYWIRLFIWIISRRKFRVVRNWDFQLPGGRPKIRIPENFVFDGASIPRPFWWILSPVGLLLIPGLIHDYAYKHNKLIEIKDGEEQDFIVNDNPKLYWDALFRDVAIEVNGFLVILWVAWLLLVIFGWVAWFKHRKLWIQFTLALLATIFTIGGGVYIQIF